MSQSLISIIVPCYNQAQYLDECLQSVLNQTFQNWECIIVDDGSPDNTEEVARKWTKKDVRFKYLKKENGGLSSARNFGIENAAGEWILPLDSDDFIGPEYLELAFEEFNNEYTIIYCRAEFVGAETGRWNLPNYSFREILKHNLIFCSAFYRKSDWKKSQGYDTKLIYGREDWDFWLTILDVDKKVYRLDYTGFYYRRKIASMDVELNSDVTKTNFTLNYIYQKHYDKYIQEYGNFFDLLKKMQSLEGENETLRYHNQRLLDLVNESVFTKFKRKLLK